MALSNKSYLGIDVGTSSVKIVELKKEGGTLRLLTYGFAESIETEGIDWTEDVKYAAKVINKTLADAGTTTTNVVSALPAFSVFSSIINLSSVDKKELASAVHWEAKKVIPLPLEDMVLDWKIVDDEENKKNKDDEKVLLTGAPKKLVKKYLDIFKEAKINLLSLETETFSLVRALLGNDKSTVMIVEIGSNTTDISIVRNSIPVLNRSIDLGGVTITKAICKSLNIGMNRAEQFKYDLGVDQTKTSDSVIPKTIINTLSPAINEVKYLLNLFQSKNNQKVEKIVLSGGSSMLPNIDSYLAKVLDMNVIVGDPWSRVSYPVELEPLLKEIGPKLSVAIGLAMREME